MQGVQQKDVRRHEALARRGRRPRLDVTRREQGGNVDARETAGATVVGEKHAAEVALVDLAVFLIQCLSLRDFRVSNCLFEKN